MSKSGKAKIQFYLGNALLFLLWLPFLIFSTPFWIVMGVGLCVASTGYIGKWILMFGMKAVVCAAKPIVDFRDRKKKEYRILRDEQEREVADEA